jgi:peptide-methionine (S)-S-oxide reductase
MVDATSALPGRNEAIFVVPDRHAVFGTSMSPDGADVEHIYLAMGCFWGAEEIYWRLPGVAATSVGYMGGFTEHPTYEEVCTGMTGHTEAVYVAYRPSEIDTYSILKVFLGEPRSNPGVSPRQRHRNAVPQRDLLHHSQAARPCGGNS